MGRNEGDVKAGTGYCLGTDYRNYYWRHRRPEKWQLLT